MSTSDENRLVLTRAQVREVDRRAIEEFGIPGIVLMENAGRNAATLIASWIKPRDQIAIVCGPGNNGGDGFVIARHLSNAGIAVECFLACLPERLQGDALVNFRIVEKMRLPIRIVADVASLAERIRASDLIVDALLGTGFTGAPRPPMDAIIAGINGAGRPVVAIDVPSGMDCDTGEPAVGWSHNRPDALRCVRAWRTITFVAMKKGFLAAGADSATGEVFIADIGAPAKLIKGIAASTG